jgi:hypothetical protein
MIDMKGIRYGRLLAIRPVGVSGSQVVWEFKCDCGNTVQIKGATVRRGGSKSCGCLRRELTAALHYRHGMKHTAVWRAWASMKSRCLSPTHHAYKNYGGRGIGICEEWKNSFEAFYRDMGDCPKGLSLDRIDNSKGYEPGNCRWATRKQQLRNTRVNRYATGFGKTLLLCEWAEIFGVRQSAIFQYLKREGNTLEGFAERRGLSGRGEELQS